MTPATEVMAVREFEMGGPRAGGPPVVWAGREEGPALVVVDPTGTARHDDLPPTWHPLAEHFQVAWCRLPTNQHSVEDVLETLVERRSSASLVASGQACPAALAMARQFATTVTAVLLVDPPPTPPDPDTTKALAEADIEVTVIARSHDGPADRVEAPLPLGHPEVAAAVATALSQLR